MASTFSASPITRFPTVRPDQARRSAWNAERTPITSRRSRGRPGRARDQYGLLVIPGLELTYDDPDPDEAAHALALGLRSFDPLEAGLKEAIRESRGLGAAVVAAHPHGRDPDPRRLRTTRWFWRNQGRLDGLVDRFELFNRDRTFGWVASAGLPAVAAGDFHRAAHLMTWKTLLPCRKQEDAVDRLSALERQGVRRPVGTPRGAARPRSRVRSFTSLIPAVHHASTQRLEAESQDQKRCRTC